LIPGFPDGAQRIGEAVSIVEKDSWVTYFAGADDYFRHTKEDLGGRRFILTSLMENKHLKAAELSGPPLTIPHRTLMNWKGQFRKHGLASFFTVLCANGRTLLVPYRYWGSSMLMSPKVVCQQSFFTPAPYAGGLLALLRRLFDLVLGPGLKRIVPGATHHLYDPHFGGIRSLELACLIFNG
jgi:hypothetical protein